MEAGDGNCTVSYIYIFLFFGHTFVLTFFPLHPQPDEVIHLARK